MLVQSVVTENRVTRVLRNRDRPDWGGAPESAAHGYQSAKRKCRTARAKRGALLWGTGGSGGRRGFGRTLAGFLLRFVDRFRRRLIVHNHLGSSLLGFACRLIFLRFDLRFVIACCLFDIGRKVLPSRVESAGVIYQRFIFFFLAIGASRFSER